MALWVDETITLFRNRLNTLNQNLINSRLTGDIEQVNSIEMEIANAENVIRVLEAGLSALNNQ
jgi:hypothetical protein